MIKNIKQLNDFAIKNGVGHVVELPLIVEGNNLIEALRKRHDEFISLLKEYEKESKVYDLDQIISEIDKLFDCVVSVSKYGNEAYSNLTTVLTDINSRYNLFDFLKKPLENKPLYRFCTYSTTLSKPKEFYHCPINKRALDTRFGKPDSYLWYLGFSEEVCKYEAKGRPGSMATFERVKNNTPLYIIDFTQDGLFYEDCTDFDRICYIFWYILLCCYCVAKEERNDCITYKFPQQLSQYLKENYPSLAGIKYYTVRNDMLDPNEDTYVNVALFTREYNEEGYDIKLCEEFEMVDNKQDVKTDII